jgi:hypothetical protein
MANSVGSENQIYLSFDMPLREHGEQRGVFCQQYFSTSRC